MKKRFSIVAVAAMAVMLMRCVGCGENYSNGERAGVVRKLSCKGYYWKSWEGELLMTVPGNIAPDTFTFNVDPAAVDKVKAAMESGKRVSLVYRQWAVKPMSIDSDYVIIDVKEAPAEKN